MLSYHISNWGQRLVVWDPLVAKNAAYSVTWVVLRGCQLCYTRSAKFYPRSIGRLRLPPCAHESKCLFYRLAWNVVSAVLSITYEFTKSLFVVLDELPDLSFVFIWVCFSFLQESEIEVAQSSNMCYKIGPHTYCISLVSGIKYSGLVEEPAKTSPNTCMCISWCKFILSLHPVSVNACIGAFSCLVSPTPNAVSHMNPWVLYSIPVQLSLVLSTWQVLWSHHCDIKEPLPGLNSVLAFVSTNGYCSLVCTCLTSATVLTLEDSVVCFGGYLQTSVMPWVLVLTHTGCCYSLAWPAYSLSQLSMATAAT